MHVNWFRRLIHYGKSPRGYDSLFVGQGLVPCLYQKPQDEGGSPQGAALHRGMVNCILSLLLIMLVWITPAYAGNLAQTLDAFGVQQPRVHKSAPDFSLSSPGGDTKKLSDYHGRVVLLTFWATWCAPCRHEMPQIEALWKEYRNQGLIVLAVNVDRGNRDGVVDFVHSLHLTFPVLFDTDGSVRNRYEVRALPTSYLIGRDGKIIGRIIGERDWSSPKAQAMMTALTEQGETRR